MIPSNQPRQAWPAIAVLLAIGVHLVSVCWHVLHNGMNLDEGFYALAARAVWQGELPYRDFGYTQMPLLPYINGALLQLTGHGLIAQRAVNALWAALTLVFMARWLGRRTTPTWGLGVTALFSLSAAWMYFTHLGKTYAFAGLMAMGAALLHLDRTPSIRKAGWLALLGTFGVGCRLPMAPFFGVLWLAALVELPRRELLRAVAWSTLWPMLLVGPFYGAAPSAAYFWTVQFHQASVPNRIWWLPWPSIVALAPALWLVLASGVVHAAVRRAWPSRRELVLALAMLGTVAANLAPKGAFEEYAVPMLPILGITATLLLWNAGAAAPWLRRTFTPIALLGANLVLTVALQWPNLRAEVRNTWSMFLPLNAPIYDTALPGRLTRARQVVQHYLPPGQPLIGPSVILAAEADRPVPRGLRMGPYTTTAEFSAARARELNLATIAEVEAWFNDPGVPLLALSKNPFGNYLCSMPSYQNSVKFRSFSWQEFFHRDFLIAYEDTNFLLLIRRNAIPSNR